MTATVVARRAADPRPELRYLSPAGRGFRRESVPGVAECALGQLRYLYARAQRPRVVRGNPRLRRSGERLGAGACPRARGWRHHSMGHLRPRELRHGGEDVQRRAPGTARRSQTAALSNHGLRRSTTGRGACGLPGTRGIGTGGRTMAIKFRRADEACSPAAACAWEYSRTDGCRRPPRRLPMPCRRSSARLSCSRRWCSTAPAIRGCSSARARICRATQRSAVPSARCGGWKRPRFGTAAGHR